MILIPKKKKKLGTNKKLKLYIKINFGRKIKNFGTTTKNVQI